MILRPIRCSRFRRLTSESHDRFLSEREESFLDSHRLQCERCSRVAEESGRALRMLRMAGLEHEPDHLFGKRIVRRVKVQQVRAQFNYWSPAVFGAAIAGIAILAALQMIADSSRLPALRVPGANGPELTRRDPTFPRLDASETAPNAVE